MTTIVVVRRQRVNYALFWNKWSQNKVAGKTTDWKNCSPTWERSFINIGRKHYKVTWKYLLLIEKCSDNLSFQKVGWGSQVTTQFLTWKKWPDTMKMHATCLMHLVRAPYVCVVHVPQKLMVWKHHTDHNRPDHHTCKAQNAVISNKNNPIPTVNSHQPHFCQQGCVMTVLTTQIMAMVATKKEIPLDSTHKWIWEEFCVFSHSHLDLFQNEGKFTHYFIINFTNK